MRTFRLSNGETITLAEPNLLGAGGEARIYKIPNHPHLVAKLWHKPTPERGEKVRLMIANPPVDPMAGQHVSIAWPIDLLVDAAKGKRAVGFLMPFVGGMRPLFDFFNPKTRREHCPLFNWFYLHRTARNMATAIRALHERGYVIGDLNESNVMVSETSLATIVDTDSFQVIDRNNNHIFRCRVGKPELTPPEMQGKTFANFTRTPAQDRFGLAILIHQLLMEGTHPFAGHYTGVGEPPPYEARISAGHYPYAGDSRIPYHPKPTAPPFHILHRTLQHLFQRCFVDGHARPEQRPDAQSWQYGLEEAELGLVSCWANMQHVYNSLLEQCPWCERAQLLGGRDPFPSVEAVQTGTHLKKIAPPRTRRTDHPAPVSHTAPPIPAHVSSNSPSATYTPKVVLGSRPGYYTIGSVILAIISVISYWINWPLSLISSAFGLVVGIMGVEEALDAQNKNKKIAMAATWVCLICFFLLTFRACRSLAPN